MNKETLVDFFQNGFVEDLFKAKYNYEIWKNVTEDYDFLTTLDTNQKKMYGFIQNSSLTLAVIYLAKIIDVNPKSRSLINLLKRLNSIDSNDHMHEFLPLYDIDPEWSEKLKEAASANNILIFFHHLSDHYLELISKSFQFKEIKIVRNKRLAHNDSRGVLEPAESVKHSSIEWAFDHLLSLLNVISLPINQSRYSIDLNSIIESSFVSENISKLKREIGLKPV